MRSASNESTTKEGVMELHSLGIDAKEKADQDNDKEEMEELVDILKQSMIQDYKTAFSKNGDKHEEEAKATVNV